jgi:hypothetical protein
MLTLDNPVETKKFYQLLSNVHIDPSCVTYLTTYKDNFFFDFIAKTDNQFINFCHITETNLARYQVILQFHEWIKLNPSSNFVPSIVKLVALGGIDDMWFYEEIPYYNNLDELSVTNCLQIDNTIKSFNDHVKIFSKTINPILQHNYNLIIKNYCNTTTDFDNGIVFEYGDIFTMFRCNRITMINNDFYFAGYQGFLYYEKILTPIGILIMSSLNDSIEEKNKKLLQVDKLTLTNAVQVLIKKSNFEFKGFLNQDDEFNKHIAQLEMIAWTK